MFGLKNTGFTKEQLTSLGVTKDTQGTVHNTSSFPALNCRPMEIKCNPSIDYKIVWKEEFRSHLFDTHSSNSEVRMTDNISYSSEMAVSLISGTNYNVDLFIISHLFQSAFEKEHKKKMQFKFAYSQMPFELRSSAYKKKLSSEMKPSKAKKLKMDSDKIQEKLKILEQKESEKSDQIETQNRIKGEIDSDDDLENVIFSRIY